MDDTKKPQDLVNDVEEAKQDSAEVTESEKSEEVSEADKVQEDVQEETKEKNPEEVEVAPLQEDVIVEEKKDGDAPSEENTESAGEPPVVETPGLWYVVHVKTSYEGRVKESLEQRIKSLGVEDKIFDIVIPVRETIVVKKGKKTNIKEKVFPGYIFIKMILDDDSWLVVRTTQGVTGFVGAGTKPTPITEREVGAIMKFIQQEQPKFKTKFSTGEAVKIIEGPFSDFLGTVESIDDERGKVKVLVSIFDRETPVELDFLQVSKI